MSRVKKFREWVGQNNHKIQGCIWIGLAVPSVLWWSESVLWVILLSIYANAESSFAAHQAKKNNGKSDE